MTFTEIINGIILTLGVISLPIVVPILTINQLSWCKTQPATYFKVGTKGLKRNLFIIWAVVLELCLIIQLLFWIIMLLLLTGLLEPSWPVTEQFNNLIVPMALFGSLLNVFAIWFTTTLLWDRKYSRTNQQS